MPQSVMLITITIAFLTTVVISPILIPFLKRLKFGQSIREEGPESHQAKSGTPTMGGLIIIMAVIFSSLFMIIRYEFTQLTSEVFILIFILLGYGLIGFLDDFIKIYKERNLGLTSKQKLFFQLLIAVVVYFILHQHGYDTSVHIPVIDYSIQFGWFYGLFLLIMLVGSSNAVNLTDGLDGLVAGTASIAFATFAVMGTYNHVDHEIIIFALSVVGALLGFLVFNSHPAKVFMGDTGSLPLGAVLAAVAILMKLELLLIIIGGVFVIETLSVMIQVAYFKMTNGKRVFRMTPLHHHYELSGWSEWRVVVTFWVVGIICAAIGLYIEVWM